MIVNKNCGLFVIWFIKINSLVMLKTTHYKIKVMSDNKEQAKLNASQQNQEEDSFSSWLNDLEDKEQPQACSIDNPECEACGS